MNELQAFLSPTTLPCNSETDQADVQYSELQLTVANVSGAAIPELELQIQFVVDPAGTTGTQSSLVLAEYSAQVSGMPAPGINWGVTSSQDTPCTFLVSPNSGQMQADEQAVFLFTSIAVDLAQGVSPVTVIALFPTGVTVQNTPAVTKAAPVLTIVSFTANPLNLIPGLPGPAGAPDNQTVLTWSTVGAGECQLGWDQTSAQVSYNGSAVENNSQVPRQATGETDSPAIAADLFDTTEFTLSATGPTGPGTTATIPQSCVVVVNPAMFSASTDIVSPYGGFALTWVCLNDSQPTLTWQSDDPDAVQSITGSNGQPIIPNVTQLNPSDSASVIIISAVTFTLNMIAACQPVPPVTVGVYPVELTGFTGSAEVINAVTGQQAANLTWAAVNVIGFTLSGEDRLTGIPIPVDNLAYTASNATVNLPLVTFPGQPWPQPDPVTFTLAALGYNPPQPATCTVVPLQVSLASFTASAYAVGWGNSVTLQWSAVYTTGFTISQSVAGTTLASPTFPANLQSWATPRLYATATFEITAYGYMPSGSDFPTLTLTVEVGPKPKEKNEGKEYIKERGKESFAELPQVQPGAPAADLPSGSEQAFITADERPDVGVDLPGGPGDEQP
jgi:hypothetical protein